MANFLVTGGAGFIGSNIVHYLVKKGESVRAIDNLSTGKQENLAAVIDKIEFIEGDICDTALLRKALDDVDYVLHQAALPSVPRSLKDPLSSNESNITGTLKLLEMARKGGVKRIVYAGSSSAYGDQPTPQKSEDQPPNPLSPYALTKLAGEYYCRIYYKCFDLETICLRYFNIFGPNQDPESQYAAVIPRFITAALKGQPPIIYGDGYQSRDFTYVENAVIANLLAAKAAEGLGEVFNIACGDSYNLHQLLELVSQYTGKEIKPEYAPPRKGDVRHSRADISRARKLLGYEVAVPFAEGLKRTVEWYKQRLKSGKL